MLERYVATLLFCLDLRYIRLVTFIVQLSKTEVTDLIRQKTTKTT